VDLIAVGYVARAHGVRGELRVHTHDPDSTTLFDVERVFIGGVEREVQSARPAAQGAVLLVVTGVEDRDAAEALKGQAVEVRREDVPLAEGEFLVADLRGCAVFDEGGAALGEIVELLHGPQDLLVIHGDDGERILPLVAELVVSVDVAARRVVVVLPEDLPVEPIRHRRPR
jgi:16S rRNA processing protein RimM